jgi:hypothetical protein
MPVFMSYGMLYVALSRLHSDDDPYGALVIVAVHTLSEVWVLMVLVSMPYGMMYVALPMLFWGNMGSVRHQACTRVCLALNLKCGNEIMSVSCHRKLHHKCVTATSETQL